jgi:hypothetical protein
MFSQKPVKPPGKSPLECDRSSNEILEGILFVDEMGKNVLL